jgi:hypothetical protein
MEIDWILNSNNSIHEVYIGITFQCFMMGYDLFYVRRAFVPGAND